MRNTKIGGIKMYSRSVNQIINVAVVNALTRCNELGNKKKKYLKRVKNRQALKRRK